MGNDGLAGQAAEASRAFLQTVRAIVAERMERVLALTGPFDADALLPGKMLRSRLAGRLVEGGLAGTGRRQIERAAAGVELVHTASLCHDDVIDNAHLRRAQPTLWRQKGATGAVLVGDLLLCEAIELLLETRNLRLVREFMRKVHQVCAAEAEQELLLRGRRLDETTCLRLAREKTGALFAFAAEACGGEDEALSAALAGAGYRLGTAYQLADDLLDVDGCEHVAGKTLGTDSKRRKFTLPQRLTDGRQVVRDGVRRLCDRALKQLADFPAALAAAERFVHLDLQPVLEQFGRQKEPETKSAI
jgi:octaprenyl-diphosphate synthase